MQLHDLLPSNPPSLSEQLRRHTNELLCRTVRANYNTQFAQTAPELTEFRHATAGLADGMDDDILSESFRKTVPLTTYDTYAPLLARFFERPCKASAIVDLFAPGIPDFIAESSSTSGGLTKAFPKYNRLSKVRSSDARSRSTSDAPRRRIRAHMWYLGYDRMNVEDEASGSTTTIYLTNGTVVTRRMKLYLDPETDGEKMAIFIPDHAAPYAAGFIKKWRSFLLIHALFAIGSRSLETMSMAFLSTFVDMIRHLDI